MMTELDGVGETGRVVLVSLVHLHIQRSLSVSSIKTDNRKPEPPERVPMPGRERFAFQPYADHLGRFCLDGNGDIVRR